MTLVNNKDMEILQQKMKLENDTMYTITTANAGTSWEGNNFINSNNVLSLHYSFVRQQG